MPYRVENPRRRHSLYAVLVAGAVAGIVALGITLASIASSNGATASRAGLVAHQALTRADRAEAAAQASYTLCVEDKIKHGNTIDVLNREYREFGRRIHRPAKRRQLRESLKFSLLLINQLVPARNCSTLKP